MPITNRMTGESIEEEAMASAQQKPSPEIPTEAERKLETQLGLISMQLSAQQKELKNLSLSIESYLQKLEGMNTEQSERMINTLENLLLQLKALEKNPKESETVSPQKAAREYAAAVANSFDEYCARILAQRFSDVGKRLDPLAEKYDAILRLLKWLGILFLLCAGSMILLFMLLVLFF